MMDPMSLDYSFWVLSTLCPAYHLKRLAMTGTYRIERYRARVIETLAEDEDLHTAVRLAIAVLRVERMERMEVTA